MLLEWKSRSIFLERPVVKIGGTGFLSMDIEGKVVVCISRSSRLLVQQHFVVQDMILKIGKGG
jgi:hypothetical protein